jgi:hypothetical protein
VKEGIKMYVLFIVLNGTDYLDEILAKFVDIGVRGATILDSQGMASAILESQNRGIPLFGLFEALLDDSRPYNKTIFTVLESKQLVDKTVAVVQDIMKDVPRPGAGFMFTIPIDNTFVLGKPN